MVDGRMPTVPEYYEEQINQGVDLIMYPKQCCPFHQENTPSFSYNIATGRWSCFGKCHAHGDVIDMHQRWFHFSTREEAEKTYVLDTMYLRTHAMIWFLNQITSNSYQRRRLMTT